MANIPLPSLRPDCVDLSVFAGREVESGSAGVVGEDPRRASVETGRKACELIVQGMTLKARELIAKRA